MGRTRRERISGCTVTERRRPGRAESPGRLCRWNGSGSRGEPLTSAKAHLDDRIEEGGGVSAPDAIAVRRLEDRRPSGPDHQRESDWSTPRVSVTDSRPRACQLQPPGRPRRTGRRGFGGRVHLGAGPAPGPRRWDEAAEGPGGGGTKRGARVGIASGMAGQGVFALGSVAASKRTPSTETDRSPGALEEAPTPLAMPRTPSGRARTGRGPGPLWLVP